MRLLVGLVLLSLLLSSAVLFVKKRETPRVVFDRAEVIVELAATEEARVRGLSNREELAPDHGMLFVFEQPAEHALWMNEMNFAIDILWLGQDGTVLDIKRNATPESYPEVFRPDAPANYVLEVNSGFADRYDIDVGDRVEIVLP